MLSKKRSWSIKSKACSLVINTFVTKLITKYKCMTQSKKQNAMYFTNNT